jgi:hypothetical protein
VLHGNIGRMLGKVGDILWFDNPVREVSCSTSDTFFSDAGTCVKNREQAFLMEKNQ